MLVVAVPVFSLTPLLFHFVYIIIVLSRITNDLSLTDLFKALRVTQFVCSCVCVCVCLGQGQNLKLTNPAVWPLCLSPFPPSTAMSLHDRLTNDLAKPWVARPLADWARLRRTMHELPACLLSAWLSLRITSAPVTAWALTPLCSVSCIATPRQRQGGQEKKKKELNSFPTYPALCFSCCPALCHLSQFSPHRHLSSPPSTHSPWTCLLVLPHRIQFVTVQFMLHTDGGQSAAALSANQVAWQNKCF